MKPSLITRWCALSTLVLLQCGCIIEGTYIHHIAAMTLCPIIIHAHSGAVTLLPSGVVPVCSGDQLELMCTITGDLLQWSFSVFRGNDTAATDFRRTITPNSAEMLQLTVDSLVFNFSRISAHGCMPVISRLVISPLTARG